MLFEVFVTINHTYSMNWFIRSSHLNMCLLKVGHTKNVLTKTCLRVCPTKQLICKFYCITQELCLTILRSYFHVNLFIKTLSQYPQIQWNFSAKRGLFLRKVKSGHGCLLWRGVETEWKKKEKIGWDSFSCLFFLSVFLTPAQFLLKCSLCWLCLNLTIQNNKSSCHKV